MAIIQLLLNLSSSTIEDSNRTWKTKYDEGETINPEELKAIALTSHNTLQLENRWITEDPKMIALVSHLKNFKQAATNAAFATTNANQTIACLETGGLSWQKKENHAPKLLMELHIMFAWNNTTMVKECGSLTKRNTTMKTFSVKEKDLGLIVLQRKVNMS